MSRRHKPAAHENHERWLVSYADFITLLFAFFVVMFASSQADKTKAKRVSEAVRQALEQGQLGSVVAGLLGRNTSTKPAPPPQPQTAAPSEDLSGSLAYLSNELEEEIRSGQVKLELQPRGLIISLREAAVFPSGDDSILDRAIPSLEKIASVIARLPNAVRLEGHTDSVPIHNERFHGNWELSAARAIAMLELFTDRFHIPSGRLCIAGYADNVPVESNDSAEGRAHNRRVDVVIVNPNQAIREILPRAATPPKP
jgi:chemotaxis protein MotB